MSNIQNYNLGLSQNNLKKNINKSRMNIIVENNCKKLKM